jgi:hypothetical protein
MRMRIRIGVWAGGLAVWLAVWALPAAAQSGMRVVAIRVAGQAQVQPVDVFLVLPPRGERRALSIVAGGTLASGTEIEVPARTVIELESPAGNRSELAPGTRFRVESVSARGEWYTLSAGRVFMRVRDALNFYNVDFERFVARVRGTEFTLSLDEPGQALAVVQEGTVSVMREQAVDWGDGSTPANVLVTEKIQAGQRSSAAWPRTEAVLRHASPQAAMARYRADLADAEARQDVDATFAALNNLGLGEMAAGQHETARAHFQRLLTLADAGGDDPWRARALNNLAAAHMRAQRWPEARDALLAALQVNRALGSEATARRIAQNEGNLGVVWRQLRDPAQALAATQRSQALYRAIDGDTDSPGVASNLDNLGHLEPARAIDWHGQALAMRQRLHGAAPHAETALSHANLGNALCLAGRTDEGVAQLDAALAMNQARQALAKQARNHSALAACWLMAVRAGRPGAMEKAEFHLRLATPPVPVAPGAPASGVPR